MNDSMSKSVGVLGGCLLAGLLGLGFLIGNAALRVKSLERTVVVKGLAEREEIAIAPPTVTDLHAQSYGDKRNILFRYTGSSTVTVYSANVAAVRAAMRDVISLGKQGVALSGEGYQGQTQFVFSGLSVLKPEMIEEATRNARSVAEKFAADSDSRLGKIRFAQQGQFSIENRDSTTPHIKKVRVVSTVEYYLAD